MTVTRGLVLWTESPLRVWHLSGNELAGRQGVGGFGGAGGVVGQGSGVVAVTRTGMVLVVDRDGDRVVRFRTSPDADPDRDVVAVPLGGRGEGCGR